MTGRSCDSSIEHVSDLGALGADCDTARRIATAYDAKIMSNGDFPGGVPVPVADRWKCTATLGQGSDEVFGVICDTGDRALESVTFVWGV